MTRKSRILSAISALALVYTFGLGACSDNNSNPTGGGGNPTPPASLTYDEFVRPLFLSRCGGSACHVNQSTNGFNVTTYTNLLAGGNTLGTGITPNNTNSSSVYRKLLVGTPIPPRMPFGGPFLPQSTIDSIALWINAGAPQSP